MVPFTSDTSKEMLRLGYLRGEGVYQVFFSNFLFKSYISKLFDTSSKATSPKLKFHVWVIGYSTL